MKSLNKHINLHPDVENALKAGLPVVALESTIIAYGMPYPDNLEFAFKAENIVRSVGAVPATIAIINGVVRIGLSDQELELLADNKNKIEKVALRDIGYVVANKLSGATTVSATMHIACGAGIKVFATGGIGGVHRNAENTYDVSQDLLALSKYPMVVVSAGVKAILDIPKTLEQLETLAVTVVGYKTDEFPAFYSQNSGNKVNLQVDTPYAITDIYSAQQELGIDSALLVANPIPLQDEIPFVDVDSFIKTALKECAENNISGKQVTPFLLQKIVALSGNKSLDANIALALNNVRLAAEISKFLK